MVTIEIDNQGKWFRPCVCKWYRECNHMTKLFCLHGSNDVRGEECVRLDLSGDAVIKKKLRQAVLKKMGTNEDSIKNMKDVIVARHHWILN